MKAFFKIIIKFSWLKNYILNNTFPYEPWFKQIFALGGMKSSRKLNGKVKSFHPQKRKVKTH